MNEKLNHFEDILKPRREEFSNFLWVSRELTPKLPFKHIKKLNPEDMKLEVLKSEKIKLLIENECVKGNISKEELIDKIKDILDEIGYNRKLQLIRWLGLFLSKMFTRVCTGIHLNRISMSKLRSTMGNVPVMYVPSHRSYADFILMSYICFHYDIEIPAIAAGMDFHGMMGMGTVLRNTGAFFMRRSYNDDTIYWDTFREYVHQLVTKGDLGIEFFIEGTRSRSGKSLYPKLGLLSMILKSYFLGEIPDILFVPINISYDRVMEERLFGFELLGVPKPKESTSGFFKSLSLVKEKYGNVYVNFGKPLSAHEFFGKSIDRSVHGTKPTHIQVVTEKERQMTLALAQSIVNHQQKLATITTFNLIATIMIENIIYKNEVLTIETLMKEMVWLKEIIEKLGAITDFVNILENVLDSLHVHSNLVTVSENNEISILQNKIQLNNIDKTKLKGYELSEETMIKSVPFVLLQLYVNPTLHYFVNPALITVILKEKNQNDWISKDILFGEYSFLRSLFSKEFVLFPMNEHTDFEQSLELLSETEVIDSNSLNLKSNKKLQELLCNLLEPFIFTYYNLCSVLINLDTSECSEMYIIRTTQANIERCLCTNNRLHPYCLSLDTISNCIQSLIELKALQRIKKDNKVIYSIRHKNLGAIFEKLHAYVICLIPSVKMVSVRAKL